MKPDRKAIKKRKRDVYFAGLSHRSPKRTKTRFESAEEKAELREQMETKSLFGRWNPRATVRTYKRHLQSFKRRG